MEPDTFFIEPGRWRSRDRRPATRLLLALILTLSAATASAQDAQDAHDAEPPAGSPPGLIAHDLTIRGFADVGMNLDWSESSSSRGAFYLGQFDLYLASRITPSLSFLGESVFEADEDGAWVVDVERVALRYAFNDRFRVVVGRTHTALGYWNEAYHHGALLQPTVERPEALKFEDDGGILPVHAVGVELSGRAATGGLELGYVLNVANGRGSVPDAVQGASDLNRRKAVAGKLSLTAGGLHSLTIGPSLYVDAIPGDPAVPGREGEILESIPGGHLVYRDARFELMAEAMQLRHRDRSSDLTFEHVAGYAIGGITFGNWTSYGGVDFIDFEAGDPFFAGADSDLTRAIGGIRYVVSDANTVKLEYRRDDRPTGVTHVVAIQSAFAF